MKVRPLSLLFFSSCLILVARAGEVARVAPVSLLAGGSVEFVNENDVYGGHSDRYYTNGMRFAYLSAPIGDDAALVRRWHLGVAQEIYAPESRYTPAAPAGDWPYSAWLYASAGMTFEHGDALDVLTLRAGVVGPSALGREVQNNYHHAIGVLPLKGWDSQLHDEPGVDIEWRHTHRFVLLSSGGWTVKFLPRVSLEGGTVRDYASAGAQLVFGYGEVNDFGVVTIRQGGVDGAPVVLRRRESLTVLPDACHLFLDVQGEAWARNMPLDGNLWHDSASVDSNTFVGQFGGGISAYWGCAKVTLSQLARTREFSTQNGLFWFGGLTVRVAY